jgi:PadR family transcriptional regulator AphA
LNVRTLCLGILWFSEATGYEIKKLASEGRFSHFIEASFGSIYPALTKLTREGLVTRHEDRATGRLRNVYRITDAGRAELIRALDDAPGPDVFKSEFLFVCLYAEHLDPGRAHVLLETRISQMADGLARLKECAEKCEHDGSRFALGYGVALHEAALAYLKSNRGLIERIHAPRGAAE